MPLSLLASMKTPSLAILAAVFTAAFTGCSTLIPPNLGDSSSPRGGEPTVSEKHAAASSQKTRTPDHPALGKPHDAAQQKEQLTTVGGVNVYTTQPFPAVIYRHGLEVDSDGSPYSYHPKPDDGEGLDYLADAGHPGNWWGIVTDNGSASGSPVIQTSREPAPGFYVSSTSLEDPNFERTDPRKYVNASAIPFIVLPVRLNDFGGHLGDIAAVCNFSNGKVAYAIAADQGPSNKLGEGSVALAKALGVNPSARDGGVGDGIGYCFFPRSGTGRPQKLAEINQIGAELFSKFGGIARLRELLDAD